MQPSRLQLRERQPATTSSLGALTSLFGRLHAESIVYCHWKSNEHLRAAMAGDTDLDLLVDRRAALPFARILSELGFKRFSAVPERSYPAIEDYLGLDRQTGKLIHLHVHYRLVLGERDIKGYRLPWETLVLSTRVLDEQHDIYVADANVELLLLVVRAALKLRARDLALAAVRHAYFQGGMLREFRWLAERVQPDRLLGLARELVGERAARLTLEMIAAPPPSVSQLRAFRRCADPGLREYRTYDAVEALRRGWARELDRLWHYIARRSRRACVPRKRTLPHGGLLVALVGPDGSGKSTLTLEVARWLSWKVDVVRLYMGNGQGAVSLARRLVHLLAAACSRALVNRRPAGAAAMAVERDQPPPRAAYPHRLRRLGLLLWVMALARERRLRFELARRARNRGIIVICDRFPQRQFLGFNDGPWLTHCLRHRFWPLRAAARRELAAFRAAEIHPPDLVIKLHVTPDVASRRKPDTPKGQLRRKIEAVQRLRYPPSTRVVDIDANQPLEHVLLQVKQAIWESI